MDSVITRDDLAGFLKNPGNARKLNVLVEDIREALMDYQVCTPKSLTPLYLTYVSDFVATGHLRRELPTDCESHSCKVRAFVVTRE